MSEVFDLVILGSGPGGYVCAIRAAQLGLKVAIVEKDPKFGGTCLHRGCIPTKALLHDADLYEKMLKASRFGIEVDGIRLNFEGVQKHKTRVVRKLSIGVEGLLKKNKVTTLHGFGVMKKAGVVGVGDREVRAKNIVIATGSEAQGLPGIEPDGKGIITNVEALELPEVPESLLVVGAGAVGVEFASIYHRFGTKVTLVERMPQLVPVEDRDVAKELEKSFRKKGIDVHTETKVEKVSRGKSGYEAQLAGKKLTKVKADLVLVAVGRKPNTDGIGLEKTRAKLDRGLLQVDGYMETAEPGLYAIGDVVPTPALAHVASAEGILVAEKLAGREVKPINYDRVPNVTFCNPQIASVGLSEMTAKERGYDVRCGKFPFMGIGKASIEGENEGFAKVVAEKKYGEILGIHVIHAHAGELVAEATAVLNGELTAADLTHVIHAHPTLSEAILEASHAIYGHPIHI